MNIETILNIWDWINKNPAFNSIILLTFTLYFSRKLENFKNRDSKFFNYKFNTYEKVGEIVAKILADLDNSYNENIEKKDFIITNEVKNQFNLERLRVYNKIAMIAPQKVIDAQDHLMDYIIEVVYHEKKYNWETVRGLYHNYINEVRKDIGHNKKAIIYKGKL